MQETTLGRSDVIVSDVCLGTMTFGHQTPPEVAFAQMDRALEAGIDFFDCAEVYPVPSRPETFGRSEQIIGDWLRRSGKRDRVRIATKVSGPGRTVRDGAGYDGAIIRAAIDESLARLGTDRVDLYQLHTPMRGSYAFRRNWGFDPSAIDPAAVRAHMEDVVGAVTDLVRQGKLRAFGVSNETTWGLLRWIDTAERLGGARVAAIQNEYSLMDRKFDTDLAEAACCEEVTLLAYSPLATGLLTGKYQHGALPADSRAAYAQAKGEAPTLGGRRVPAAEEAVAAWLGLAAEEGLDPVHMAIAFVRQRPFRAIPIIGATTLAQLDHIIAGLDLRLTPEQLARIETIHRRFPMPF